MKVMPYKILVHALCWLPLLYMVYGVFNRTLGADPQEKVMHLLGYWALLFLLIGLSVTPLRKVLRISRLSRYRRVFGLYAAFYLMLHMIAFTLFYLNADLSELWRETIKRPYISVGMLAFTLMIPLVVTSTKKMQKRLGRNWARLHRIVYLIAPLGVVHFIWQSKADLNEPLLYALILTILLGVRCYWHIANLKSPR
jgi:methionine sulfoxide reductase heme-binding subunit